jgi:hypothetical protein
LWIRIRIGSGFSDFVDPDPYWESGSRIRIPDPDPGARKLRNISVKMHFLVILKKIISTIRVENSTKYVMKIFF